MDTNECKVLLAALKSFENIKAENAPNTKSLEESIKELDTALAGTPHTSNGSYQTPEGCNTCQD